jgi:hypothetical protein
MGRPRVRHTGAGNIAANLRFIAHKYPAKVGRGVVAELKTELPEVVKRTPIEEGDLRESERIEGPFQQGKVISAAIAAGNEEVDYAYDQHENMEYYHDEGGPKFIESVLFESRPYLGERVAKRIRIDEKDF